MIAESFRIVVVSKTDQVKEASMFWPAEDYHQKYLEKVFIKSLTLFWNLSLFIAGLAESNQGMSGANQVLRIKDSMSNHSCEYYISLLWSYPIYWFDTILCCAWDQLWIVNDNMYGLRLLVIQDMLYWFTHQSHHWKCKVIPEKRIVIEVDGGVEVLSKTGGEWWTFLQTGTKHWGEAFPFSDFLSRSWPPSLQVLTTFFERVKNFNNQSRFMLWRLD